jgi:hypothetical protein
LDDFLRTRFLALILHPVAMRGDSISLHNLSDWELEDLLDFRDIDISIYDVHRHLQQCEIDKATESCYQVIELVLRGLEMV